jgi:hypothetical protein
MDSRDVQKVFRAALWATADEVQAFAQACEGLPLAEVLKLLGLLSDKQLAAEGIRTRSSSFRSSVRSRRQTPVFEQSSSRFFPR